MLHEFCTSQIRGTITKQNKYWSLFSNYSTKILLPLIVKEPKAHLSCPQLPVCGQAVSRVHEDFGDAQSLLDGLQLQGQQVAINPVSIKCLRKEISKNVFTANKRSQEKQRVEAPLPARSAQNKHPQPLWTTAASLPSEAQTLKTNKTSKTQTIFESVRAAHRHGWIIEGRDELQRLIGGRADVLCPSSSEHPLRGDIAGGTDLTVNSAGKIDQSIKTPQTRDFRQIFSTWKCKA